AISTWQSLSDSSSTMGVCTATASSIFFPSCFSCGTSVCSARCFSQSPLQHALYLRLAVSSIPSQKCRHVSSSHLSLFSNCPCLANGLLAARYPDFEARENWSRAASLSIAPASSSYSCWYLSKLSLPNNI